MAASAFFQDAQAEQTFKSLLMHRPEDVQAAVLRFAAFVKHRNQDDKPSYELYTDYHLSLQETCSFITSSVQAQKYISDFNQFSKFNNLFPFCLSCQKEVTGENTIFTVSIKTSFREVLSACFPQKGPKKARFSTKMISQFGQDFCLKYLQMESSAAIDSCDYRQTNVQVCCNCVSAAAGVGSPKTNIHDKSDKMIESPAMSFSNKKVPTKTAYESKIREVFFQSACGLALKDATVLESLVRP